MLITKTSILSGKKTTMELPVTDDEIKRFVHGEHAQQVWPHLTPAQREFLISGISPDEWQKSFGHDS